MTWTWSHHWVILELWDFPNRWISPTETYVLQPFGSLHLFAQVPPWKVLKSLWIPMTTMSGCFIQSVSNSHKNRDVSCFVTNFTPVFLSLSSISGTLEVDENRVRVDNVFVLWDRLVRAIHLTTPNLHDKKNMTDRTVRELRAWGDPSQGFVLDFHRDLHH